MSVDVRSWLETLEGAHFPHSRRTSIDHLNGVEALLKKWSAPPSLVTAGLCHNLYGTASYRVETVSFDSRDRVKKVLGEDAEHLVALYSSAILDSLVENRGRESDFSVQTWRDGQRRALDRKDFLSLIQLMLANEFEQAPRMNPAHLRFSYRRMLGFREWMSERVSQDFDAIYGFIDSQNKDIVLRSNSRGLLVRRLEESLFFRGYGTVLELPNQPTEAKTKKVYAVCDLTDPQRIGVFFHPDTESPSSALINLEHTCVVDASTAAGPIKRLVWRLYSAEKSKYRLDDSLPSMTLLSELVNFVEHVLSQSLIGEFSLAPTAQMTVSELCAEIEKQLKLPVRTNFGHGSMIQTSKDDSEIYGFTFSSPREWLPKLISKLSGDDPEFRFLATDISRAQF